MGGRGPSGVRQARRREGFILIDATDFSLDPAVAEHYARMASTFQDRHALGMIRYGIDEGTQFHDTVHKHHADRGSDPNVVPDRAAALERLAELRRS